MCVGGAVKPVYESTPPPWFCRELEAIFAPQNDANVLTPVTYPHYPYGANLALRASILKVVGNFNPSLGYRGTSLLPCEETELLLRIEQKGFHILYEPRSLVHHFISKNRLSKSYFRQRVRAQGRAEVVLEWLRRQKPQYKSRLRTARESAWWYRHAIRQRWLLRRTRQQTVDGNDEKEAFAAECRTLREIGRAEQEAHELFFALVRPQRASLQ